MGNTVGSQNISPFNISKSEAAFIAGFLEGDGCISAKIGPTSGSYRVRLVISFTQHTRNKVVLEYLQKLIGGKIIDYHSRNMSELAIYDRNKVTEIVRIVAPFLISKRRQAELAIKIIEILNKNKRGKLKNPEDLLKAVKLAEEIRGLNSNRKNKTVHTFDKVFTKLRKKGYIS